MMEYQSGSTVVHKSHGLCLVRGLKKIGKKEYYEIVPLQGEKVIIYVPCKSASLIFIDIMSASEADELLRYMKSIDDTLDVMDKQKRDEYKRKIQEGDRYEIAFLARKLHFLKEDKESRNMELGSQDQALFERARNRLLDEFSLSYSVPRDQVENFIDGRIEKV
ncbi:MAG: CarD family transcriptional regulator [Bacilli bacterium]|jgi:RNA polymerase-interacting CarD/CdnL/TRCF family regulator